METKTDILNELAFLSPVIAGFNKVNVFTVPRGYFESVPTTVLACLGEGQSFFKLPENKEMQGVPVGYFDQLANSILDKIKASQTSREEIMNLSPLLSDIQNKNVFEVPSGYFENLNDIVIDKLRSGSTREELREISPLLYGIQRKVDFEVPRGYFAALSDNILKKVKPRTAIVVTMRKRSFFIKYAIAAMMTGIMAIGLYKYNDKPRTGVSNENGAAFTTLDASIEKGKIMNDQQFNEAMENLNDADIAKYLENNGDITDVAVLRNNLEDVNLPSQDDYLLDGTTLEKYLREIEKTTLNN